MTVGAGGGGTAPTVGALAPTTLSAGAVGGTATGNVPVTVATAGTAPGSLALACTIPATAPSNFLITAGANRTINAPATLGANAPDIGVSCVRQAAATTATLTCTQNATPDPDPAALTAVITCPAGTGGGDTSPTVALTPNPLNLTGSGTVTGTLTGTPSAGTGTATTTVACSIAAGASAFTVTPASRIFTGPTTTAQTFAVGCTTQAAATTGTLACTTTRSDGVVVAPTNITVNCPASAAATPEFTSMPPAGTTITLNGSTGGTSPTSLVTVTNSEPATTLIVSAAITGAGLSVAPAGPVNIAGGASQAFTVSCATATAGTVNGVLTFTTNDPDDGEGTVTYPVTCNIITGGAQATAVPTLSTTGKLIAIFSVLGLGLLGFAVSRRT